MSLRPTGHHGEKPSETMARFVVEKALGVRVCSYDDRRGVSRVDAIIHRHGGVPLETVSAPWVAGNKQSSALDRRGRRARFDGLTYGYKVCLTSSARVNDLRWVEPTLRRLESPETGERVPSRTEDYEWIVRFPFVSAGDVLFTTGGGGGRADYHPTEVVHAASAILARTDYADVARKLDDYGGHERHAVIIVDDDETPAFGWLRELRLVDLERLPDPELPEEVTHLWLTPRGVRGMTMLWSASTHWRGMAWRWDDPVDALNAWDDPTCRVHGAD